MVVKDVLYGILRMEYGSPESAERGALRYGGCPRVAFWATKGSDAYIVLRVGEDERFWAEYIGEHPENTFGGRRAELVFAEKIHRPILEMKKPEELGDVSPCGSRCTTCPGYATCTGCPATIHYKG
ncbi:MAG: hypothetical protein OEW93_01525 [Candidatus Bathyarchaeota archaeon]|nr:hypothetical protein [Candidatus Bathyarchaeota archaeon]